MLSIIDKNKLMELIIKALPYSEQIKNLDLSGEENAIRFEWRGDIYRVTFTLFVEEKQGKFLSGTNSALLLEALLTRTFLSMEECNERVKATS